MNNGKQMVSSSAKWEQQFGRVYAQINYVTEDDKNGGVVCTMRADDFGNFEQMPLFMKSRQMRDLLVKIYNENKVGYKIMGEIAETLGPANIPDTTHKPPTN